MSDRAHDGDASTLSVAVTLTDTATAAPLGGAIVDGSAETLVMTGADVSGGTTTSTALVAKLPAASLHDTANEYRAPLRARTQPVSGPVTMKSVAGAPWPSMPTIEQTGDGSRSSVAVADTVTVTIALFGGSMVEGDAESDVMTGSVVSRAGIKRKTRGCPFRRPTPAMMPVALTANA